MKILLDENLPRKLLSSLRAEGHEVESVHTLRLQGIANGRIYEVAQQQFDPCFTRDAGFAHNVRQQPNLGHGHVKLVRVVLPQKPQDQFVADFLVAFHATNWDNVENGAEWPTL